MLEGPIFRPFSRMSRMAQPSSPTQDESGPQVKQDVLHGVRWSAVARYGVQSIQLATSLTLARLLEPENFGLLAMALVFVEFSRICLNLGFSQVIIQRKDIDDELLSSLFYCNIGLAILLTATLAAASPLVAWFYGNPDLTLILLSLTLVLVLASPSLVPAALLNRQLRFARLAFVDITTTCVQAGCAIGMALAGFEVWSLVGGAIASAAVRPVLTHLVSPWRPSLKYSRGRVREVMSFSANLTGFEVFNFFSRNADNLIIGRFLGDTPLGYYTLAYRILNYPRDAVSSVIGRVLLPAFSRLQDDDRRLAAAYLRVCRAIAFVTFPMMLGLMAVADSFVRAVLGEKWLPALPVIYIFCPLGMIQSIGTTVGHLFVAKGRADMMFRVSVIRSMFIVGSFFIGIPWGIVGVATSYASMIFLTWFPSLWFVFKLVAGLRMRDFVRTLLPYTVYSSVMGASVFGLQITLRSAGVPAWLTLVICVPGGVALYTGIVLLVKPPALHDFLELFPRLRRKAVQGTAAAPSTAPSSTAPPEAATTTLRPPPRTEV